MTKKTTRRASRAAAKTPSTWSSPSLALTGMGTAFSRADLVFDGIEHGGPSFEARVFLNNLQADMNTPLTATSGYVGSFHIFGHGGCFGDDPTHCSIRQTPRLYDPRPAHPLTPARKVVIATEAIRR